MRRKNGALFIAESPTKPASSHICSLCPGWLRKAAGGNSPGVQPPQRRPWSAELVTRRRGPGGLCTLALSALPLAEGQPAFAWLKWPVDLARRKAQPRGVRVLEGNVFRVQLSSLRVRRALSAPRKCGNKTNMINKFEQFLQYDLGSVWPEGRI